MLNTAPALDREAIARRIPHQGRMCLLERVIVWDAEQIRCEAANHQEPDHPLRSNGRLGSACGVEYAAQAMAVHGALMAERQAGHAAPAPRAGYLAGVRNVAFNVDRLDDVRSPLTVRAQRLTGDDNTVLYSFSVEAGARALLSGRAIVVLDATALPAGPLGERNVR